MKNTSPRFSDAALALALFTLFMAWFVIGLNVIPQIPMMLGIAATCVIAMRRGIKWEDLEKGMVSGISQALVAMIIILLIGVLIGTWISGGVVPAMIYFGLKLVSPKYFLVSAMTLCAMVSLLMGAWGSAGTVGIALIGIAKVLGIPAELAAGAIISGCYVGELASPISDAANLVSAVSRVNVIKVVKSVSFPTCVSVSIALGIYAVIGLKYSVTDTNLSQIDEICKSLQASFYIGAIDFLPLVILIVCIMIKMSSIPSLFISALSSSILAVLVQHRSLSDVAESAYYGFAGRFEDEMMNTLLTAGGIESMMETISLCFIAMMFGGIMEKANMIHAFMTPITKRLRSASSLVITTVLSSFCANAIMADQYVAIALTGKMFLPAYNEKEIEETKLSCAVASGGCPTSPLFPWNTCGMYMAGILGVSAFSYLKYAYWNMLAPIVVIAITVIASLRQTKSADKRKAL